MTPGTPTRRGLGEVLPQTAGPARTSWLTREPAPPPAAVPPPCPSCAELTTLRADLRKLETDAITTGRTEGAAETAALRARLTAATTAIESAQAATAIATIDAIVDVALAVVAELAPAAAAIDRAATAALIAQVVTAADGQAVIVRVHPDDLSALTAELPTTITLEADPTLAGGEVRASGARQVIDGSWTTRLAALREPLRALLASRPTEIR
jgi:flagellar biosynthesis/type III secretory pathway protein FliH